jgi:MFS family permease
MAEDSKVGIGGRKMRHPEGSDVESVGEGKERRRSHSGSSTRSKQHLEQKSPGKAPKLKITISPGEAVANHNPLQFEKATCTLPTDAKTQLSLEAMANLYRYAGAGLAFNFAENHPLRAAWQQADTQNDRQNDGVGIEDEDSLSARVSGSTTRRVTPVIKQFSQLQQVIHDFDACADDSLDNINTLIAATIAKSGSSEASFIPAPEHDELVLAIGSNDSVGSFLSESHEKKISKQPAREDSKNSIEQRAWKLLGQGNITTTSYQDVDLPQTLAGYLAAVAFLQLTVEDQQTVLRKFRYEGNNIDGEFQNHLDTLYSLQQKLRFWFYIQHFKNEYLDHFYDGVAIQEIVPEEADFQDANNKAESLNISFKHQLESDYLHAQDDIEDGSTDVNESKYTSGHSWDSFSEGSSKNDGLDREEGWKNSPSSSRPASPPRSMPSALPESLQRLRERDRDIARRGIATDPHRKRECYYGIPEETLSPKVNEFVKQEGQPELNKQSGVSKIFYGLAKILAAVLFFAAIYAIIIYSSIAPFLTYMPIGELGFFVKGMNSLFSLLLSTESLAGAIIIAGSAFISYLVSELSRPSLKTYVKRACTSIWELEQFIFDDESKLKPFESLTQYQQAMVKNILLRMSIAYEMALIHKDAAGYQRDAGTFDPALKTYMQTLKVILQKLNKDDMHGGETNASDRNPLKKELNIEFENCYNRLPLCLKSHRKQTFVSQRNYLPNSAFGFVASIFVVMVFALALGDVGGIYTTISNGAIDAFKMGATGALVAKFLSYMLPLIMIIPPAIAMFGVVFFGKKLATSFSFTSQEEFEKENAQRLAYAKAQYDRLQQKALISGNMDHEVSKFTDSITTNQSQPGGLAAFFYGMSFGIINYKYYQKGGYLRNILNNFKILQVVLNIGVYVGLTFIFAPFGLDSIQSIVYNFLTVWAAAGIANVLRNIFYPVKTDDPEFALGDLQDTVDPAGYVRQEVESYTLGLYSFDANKEKIDKLKKKEKPTSSLSKKNPRLNAIITGSGGGYSGLQFVGSLIIFIGFGLIIASMPNSLNPAILLAINIAYAAKILLIVFAVLYIQNKNNNSADGKQWMDPHILPGMLGFAATISAVFMFSLGAAYFTGAYVLLSGGLVTLGSVLSQLSEKPGWKSNITLANFPQIMAYVGIGLIALFGGLLATNPLTASANLYIGMMVAGGALVSWRLGGAPAFGVAAGAGLILTFASMMPAEITATNVVMVLLGVVAVYVSAKLKLKHPFFLKGSIASEPKGQQNKQVEYLIKATKFAALMMLFFLLAPGMGIIQPGFPINPTFFYLSYTSMLIAAPFYKFYQWLGQSKVKQAGAENLSVTVDPNKLLVLESNEYSLALDPAETDSLQPIESAKEAETYLKPIVQEYVKKAAQELKSRQSQDSDTLETPHRPVQVGRDAKEVANLTQQQQRVIAKIFANLKGEDGEPGTFWSKVPGFTQGAKAFVEADPHPSNVWRLMVMAVTKARDEYNIFDGSDVDDSVYEAIADDVQKLLLSHDKIKDLLTNLKTVNPQSPLIPLSCGSISCGQGVSPTTKVINGKVYCGDYELSASDSSSDDDSPEEKRRSSTDGESGFREMQNLNPAFDSAAASSPAVSQTTISGNASSIFHSRQQQDEGPPPLRYDTGSTPE